MFPTHYFMNFWRIKISFLLLCLLTKLNTFSQAQLNLGFGVVNTNIFPKNQQLKTQSNWTQEASVIYSNRIKNNILYNVGLQFQVNRFTTQINPETTCTYQLNYLRSPIYLDYIIMNKSINISLIGGVYLGYLINANEIFYFKDTLSDELLNYSKNEISNAFNKADFGLLLGLQIGLKHGFSVHIKYMNSLNKLNYNTISNQNLRIISLGVSYDILRLFQHS